MPSHCRGRPLKAWRYVGVYGPDVMLCLATVRIGRAHQGFWAIWDRCASRLHERTIIGRSPVQLRTGFAAVRDRGVAIELRFAEGGGIEAVCPHGSGYGWTRKQGGILVDGMVETADARRPVHARGVIDDTAAYYDRHTRWQWCAGVGEDQRGRAVAWNLVSGVNDPLRDSERTVWVEGEPREAPPSHFAPDLSGVDRLRFSVEAVRERRENLLLVRSRYRQPFGTFSGELSDGIVLADGYGVMEEHDVWW